MQVATKIRLAGADLAPAERPAGPPPAAAARSKLPISGVVIACNEADRIERCVRSLAALCSEVIVLDSGSGDDTVAIARAAGARVEHQDWLGYAAQKNAAIARASQPWILLLDADEWLAEGTEEQLRYLFATGRAETADIWQLQRRTHYLGQALRFGGWGREAVARLFRADLRYLPARVHERLDDGGRRLATLPARIEHDTARSDAEYRDKLRRYAALWALDRATAGRRVGRLAPWLHAGAYWLKNGLLRGGFLDKRLGRLYHARHARYVFEKYVFLRQHNEALR